MTWTSFEEGLATELGALDDRVVVTVSWSTTPTVYVQLEQTATQLLARSGADDVLPVEQRLGPERRARLETAGWVPPEVDPQSRGTWTLAVPWPARSADHDRLAAACRTVLRDVHQVPSPAELEYRAWRHPEPDPVGVTFHPEDLEPGDPHLVLPALGITDAQAA